MHQTFFDVNARDGKAFAGWDNIAAAAAMQSYIGINCTVNKELYVKSARWVMPSNSSAVLTCGIVNTVAGFSLGNFSTALKASAAVSASAIYKRNNTTGNPGGFTLLDNRRMELVSIPGGGNQAIYRLDLRTPLILPAGYGLIGFLDTVNLPLEFFVEFVEKP